MLTIESAARKDRTQPTDANFQHRHFAEIARVIRTLPGAPDIIDDVAEHFADELARTNPRFDRKRFLAACKN